MARSRRSYGVEGFSDNYIGVYGLSYNGIGLYGESDSTYGVWGQCPAALAWSAGLSAGNGVYGESDSDYGMYGLSVRGGPGVYGVASTVLACMAPAKGHWSVWRERHAAMACMVRATAAILRATQTEVSIYVALSRNLVAHLR